MIKPIYKYYLLAFLEGALIMSFELISARLIVPFYGNSLYSLTSILGITLLGLLFGYYIGAKIVNKGFKSYLPQLLIGGSCGILILYSAVTKPLILWSMSLGLIAGSLFASFCILGIPLIILGTVSPLFVELIYELGSKAGTASGNTYAVSTSGGVFATFIVGLYLIPTYGIKITTIIIGITIGVLVLTTVFISNNINKSIPALVLLILFSLSLFSAKIDNGLESQGTILYESDGLLGKLVVSDFNGARILSNNGTIQSKIGIEHGHSLLHYTHVIATVASFVQPEERKNALIIGLAGGSVVKEINELGFLSITAIDIDPRNLDVCRDYFGVNLSTFEFIEDDGRHYLWSQKASPLKYDLIVIDVSASEVQPPHLYTREALEIYRSKLTNNGIIILNIIDYIGNGKGIILDKIADGMSMLNLNPRLLKDFYPMNAMDKSKYYTHIHERIIVGSKNGYFNISDGTPTLNACCQSIPYNMALKTSLFDQSYNRSKVNSEGFRDDIPEMDRLNFSRINKLRNEDFIK